MSNSRLSSRDRLLLTIGALATLAVLGALQCAALSVDQSLRATLSLLATTLAALCAAILLQDALAPALAWAMRHLRIARASLA